MLVTSGGVSAGEEDHVKAAVFIIADGVFPSNLGRGYVLRRLIRRAVRHGRILEVEDYFITKAAESVIGIYKNHYPEVLNNREKIISELRDEEEKFEKTLDKGLKELEKINEPTGKKLFDIYQTYGFPFEMSEEFYEDKGFWRNGEKIRGDFDAELKKHQELSQTSGIGMFKGGLADEGEKTTKLHTATHLLHQALKEVLGDHVSQKGSNITPERLRFDFSHSDKLTKEEIEKVENLVNDKIKEDLPMNCEDLSVDEAKDSGAIGIFDDKYGDKVKVYSAGNFSKEICGGPHVRSTGELGRFKIKKEEASSAGVRRIKAVLD